jgi:hypothetical protein
MGSRKQSAPRSGHLRSVPSSRPEVPRLPAIPTALLAECNCPEFCERDHDNE